MYFIKQYEFNLVSTFTLAKVALNVIIFINNTLLVNILTFMLDN